MSRSSHRASPTAARLSRAGVMHSSLVLVALLATPRTGAAQSPSMLSHTSSTSPTSRAPDHAKRAAAGRARSHCRFLCAPTITLMPAAIRTHIVARPEVRSLSTGATHELPSATNFELIVSASAKTLIPRTSLYGSAQWLPTAAERSNPFTLYTASEVGAPAVRANAPTLSGGASLGILTDAETGGWLALNLNVGDLYSQAARPDDRGAYTHKLDLGLLGDAAVFSGLPSHSYLSRVNVFALLDYVATGLPRAGDAVPKGERVFVSDARAVSLIAGLSLPLVSDASH